MQKEQRPRRADDPRDKDYRAKREFVVYRNGGTAAAAGRVAMQLLVPALVAAFASYVAVTSQIARLEERIEGIRGQLQIRQTSVDQRIQRIESQLDKARN